MSQFALAALPALDDGAAVEAIRILVDSPDTLPAEPPWAHHWRSGSDTVELSVARIDAGWLLHMPGVANFLVKRSCDEVTILSDRSVAPETMEHALIDQVLPRMVAQRGEMVVHGAAAQVGGKLALFLGNSGQGKSTLAAALHRAGHRVLSDDCVVLRVEAGRVGLLPTYPSLRLLPDSLQHLYPAHQPTMPMADYSDKRRVALPVIEAGYEDLSAIFVLDSSEHGGAAPAASRTSPASVCIELAQQSFLIDPSDLSNAASGLARSAKVADSVPGYGLRYSRNFEHLPKVLSEIELRLARLSDRTTN